MEVLLYAFYLALGLIQWIIIQSGYEPSVYQEQLLGTSNFGRLEENSCSYKTPFLSITELLTIIKEFVFNRCHLVLFCFHGIMAFFVTIYQGSLTIFRLVVPYVEVLIRARPPCYTDDLELNLLW